MIAKWLAVNKTTLENEYIEVPLLNNISLSVNIAKFEVSSITVVYDDFLNYELPFAWQEIQLVEDDVTKYIFYFKSLTAPKFETNNEVIKLQMNLYSTRDLLAHRTRTVQTSGNLNEVVEDIIKEILDDDGYAIISNELPDTVVTATYIKQTIESILNTMANAYEFVWYCDRLKNIYLKPIDNLMSSDDNLTIDTTRHENYGFQIQPSISTTDYNNIVELKNIMLVSHEYVFSPDGYVTLSEGDSITFSRSIWATQQAKDKSEGSYAIIPALRVFNNTANIAVFLDDDGIPELPSNVCYSDEDSSDSYIWHIIRDPNNNNLWTGIKYNGSADIQVTKIETAYALVPTSYIYYDVEEVSSIAPYTGTSGKIQKTVDMYNKYFGNDDMLATAKGNLVKSNSIANEVTIYMEVTDKNEYYPDIQLADVIKVNVGGKLGQLIGVQSYVVTSYTRQESIKRLTYKISATNINYNNTYIDLFRNVEIQDNDEQLTNQASIYIESTANRTIKVKVNGDEINEN